MQLSDTIAAISTPPGRGGIGVVRISGSNSWDIAARILRFPEGRLPEPRFAALADLLDADGNEVDHVLATFFAAPRSYTAENLVEISCHGAPVVLRHCVARAIDAGARPAEPGEFTLRAYLHGRLDLPQAEAVRDLIDATTLYQARIAAQQAGGSVSRRIKPAKDQLIELIALLEAGIDFAEDDISVAPPEEIERRLSGITSAISSLAKSFEYGRLVHSGFSLAIVGRPNVGKSSLFNRLVEQDRAIVTDIPGTTRDTVSEVASLGGLPVKFIDTAGLRRSDDVVEALGVERSYQAMADADLTVVVLDASEALTPEDSDLIAKAQQSGQTLVVVNKVDKRRPVDLPARALPVSALTGEGVDALREAILHAVAPEGVAQQESGFITSLRHRKLLDRSLGALQQASVSNRSGIPHEMLLLDLYSALKSLDEITGATTADDILNRIFSTFCIGK